MRVSRPALVAVLLGLALAGPTAAQAAADERPSTIGLRFGVLSLGAASDSYFGAERFSPVSAYRWSAYFDRFLLPYLSLGAGAELYANFLRRSDADDGGRALIFDARVRLGYPIHDRVYPYALFAVGAGGVCIPHCGAGAGVFAFHLAAGAGVAIRIANGFFATLEIAGDFFPFIILDPGARYLSSSVGLEYRF
jgi:hypothetical protein